MQLKPFSSKILQFVHWFIEMLKRQLGFAAPVPRSSWATFLIQTSPGSAGRDSAAYFVYPIESGLIDVTAYFARAAKEAGVGATVKFPPAETQRAMQRGITGFLSAFLVGRACL